ncbi:hypothetical protein [Mycolicibacterium sp.]|uniref:hypothetical protein n=1 Tax=Mycolicibacterium sp. TaxID=2320850 RepID=UPI003D15316E
MVLVIGGGQPSVWVWLGPVLALCGSLVVALLAFLGVLWTNRRADRREVAKWKRELMVKLTAEALGEVRTIEGNYEAATAVDTRPYTDERKTASNSTMRLNEIADQLRVIGAWELANRCESVRIVAESISLPAREFRPVVADYVNAVAAMPVDSPSRDRDVLAEWMKGASQGSAKLVDAIWKLGESRRDFVKVAETEINRSAT